MVLKCDSIRTPRRQTGGYIVATATARAELHTAASAASRAGGPAASEVPEVRQQRWQRQGHSGAEDGSKPRAPRDVTPEPVRIIDLDVSVTKAHGSRPKSETICSGLQHGPQALNRLTSVQSAFIAAVISQLHPCTVFARY
ncbi:hypothetical protein SKAU_G00354430 [Synaphobranchus kaupii]|uniref:Uncharacterized protein n=1 Tax=Synaphobranchus kaupii TaxID=118154 RepID=A0A9Q1IGA4_SYNKA|nr:hypothetical protein SKAU_G00354430 [Synaphobranchus kaupii]